MPAVTLRGLADGEADRLKSEARRRGLSLNALLLRLVREGAGLVARSRQGRHDDLDALAGTWSEEDAAAFAAAVADTEKIDAELWR